MQHTWRAGILRDPIRRRDAGRVLVTFLLRAAFQSPVGRHSRCADGKLLFPFPLQLPFPLGHVAFLAIPVKLGRVASESSWLVPPTSSLVPRRDLSPGLNKSLPPVVHCCLHFPLPHQDSYVHGQRHIFGLQLRTFAAPVPRGAHRDSAARGSLFFSPTQLRKSSVCLSRPVITAAPTLTPPH